jgi:transcriptional regulator with XRE-family HTH domain
MSKAELAEAARLSPPYITELEKGDKDNPSLPTVRKVAEALEVKPEALYVRPKRSALIRELVSDLGTDGGAFDEVITELNRQRGLCTRRAS